MQSTTAILADSIMALSIVDENGRMEPPSKASLANACRLLLWEVWWWYDDAINILVSEGMVRKEGEAMYLSDAYEKYVRRLEDTMAEMARERSDETQSYDFSVMGEVL